MSEVHQQGLRRRNARLLIEDSRGLRKRGPIIGYAQEPLIGLIDACAPLVDRVHDLLSYASTALENIPDDPIDNLTRDESASIRLYTMESTDEHQSFYSILNHTLRTADGEDLRPWFKYLKLFLTALAKTPCSPQQVVWRGVRQNISNEFPPGAEVTWWSFSSCTTTLIALENDLYLGNTGERTLFSIEVFNGRNVRAHSYFHNEDETLLLPGTYMKVQSRLNPAPDLYIIHLKQNVPEELLLEPPFEGACLYPKSEQISRRRHLIAFLMGSFIPSSRHRWYRKKRFSIPLFFLSIMCLVTVILGSVLGSRSHTRTSGISFAALLN